VFKTERAKKDAGLKDREDTQLYFLMLSADVWFVHPMQPVLLTRRILACTFDLFVFYAVFPTI